MITDNTLNELLQRQAYLLQEKIRLTLDLENCEPCMYHVISRSVSSNAVFLATINSHIERYDVFNR